uniref:ADAM metallopeptidase domain 19a n=1 Tax=Electrophorus electricus TaxID=8005 RepID=A0A4W4GQU0_ELEEL
GEREILHHAFYHTDDLPVNGGTCGHGHQAGHQSLFSGLLKPLHQRVFMKNTRSETRTLHVFIFYQYKKQNKDFDKTKRRIMEIANYVDKFYRALNIRVPLIGLEVWTEHDQCIINEEPNATLWSFLQWRQKLKSRKKHDNAQLLTGMIFRGTTIGMAPLEGMCSLENSGGINDHSDLPIGAAATMAHEIGHNFGMSHDHEGCCVEASAEQGGCVMAAATGHPFPKVFSQCSKKDLYNYFQKGGGMCLFNMPNMKDLVGGKRCGNGFVEEGEECDCGEPEECTNDCCHPSNCTLKEDAQCAHGVCCEGCKLKQAGTLCRGAAGVCDLPEYCTGGSPYCPANVYLLDSTSCQYNHAYCYNGMCLTHEQQCLQLWGYGARPAHDACFQDVNAAGNAFGNCGKDAHGHYVKCEKSDAKCGKIQCHSAAKKPKGTNAVSIDTTIRTDGMEVKCRGTYVYSTQDGQGDLPDPGLVMTGTKCGEGKVCKYRRCQNASFSELEACIARCNKHGVCNSNRNCHCNRGWAPPFCDKPGLGGSVDSGPVEYDSELPSPAPLLPSPPPLHPSPCPLLSSTPLPSPLLPSSPLPLYTPPLAPYSPLLPSPPPYSPPLPSPSTPLPLPPTLLYSPPLAPTLPPSPLLSSPYPLLSSTPLPSPLLSSPRPLLSPLRALLPSPRSLPHSGSCSFLSPSLSFILFHAVLHPLPLSLSLSLTQTFISLYLLGISAPLSPLSLSDCLSDSFSLTLTFYQNVTFSINLHLSSSFPSCPAHGFFMSQMI